MPLENCVRCKRLLFNGPLCACKEFQFTCVELHGDTILSAYGIDIEDALERWTQSENEDGAEYHLTGEIVEFVAENGKKFIVEPSPTIEYVVQEAD